MKPNKKTIKMVMSYLGKLNTPAQTEARRDNMKKAREKRWPKKDKNRA